MNFSKKDRYTAGDLVEIVALLRSDQGCPWDREQTHESIRYNFIEEVYEAAEAIDLKDKALLQEELGDVLLQVVFHAQIERESGSFDFDAVADGICKKLIERHPHVFAKTDVSGVSDVLKNWDAIKKEQKGQTKSSQALGDVPKVLPALMRAQKVAGRAAKLGFGFSDREGAVRDLLDEVQELEEAAAGGDTQRIAEELGDVLFSCANIARYLDQEAEACLSRSTDRFIKRVEIVEAEASLRGCDRLEELDFQSRDELWNIAKKTTE